MMADINVNNKCISSNPVEFLYTEKNYIDIMLYLPLPSKKINI